MHDYTTIHMGQREQQLPEWHTCHEGVVHLCPSEALILYTAQVWVSLALRALPEPTPTSLNKPTNETKMVAIDATCQQHILASRL